MRTGYCRYMLTQRGGFKPLRHTPAEHSDRFFRSPGMRIPAFTSNHQYEAAVHHSAGADKPDQRAVRLCLRHPMQIQTPINRYLAFT